MATTTLIKVTASAARQLESELIKDATSPFKVLNWINSNRNKITTEDGETLGLFLERSGFGTKKLTLNDFCNDSCGKVSVLVRYRISTPVVDDMIRTMIDRDRYTKVGNYWYIYQNVDYSVKSFVKSFNDSIAIRNDRAKKLDLYTRLFERIYAKDEKRKQKEIADKTASDAKLNAKVKEYFKLLRGLDAYRDLPDSALMVIATDKALAA